MVAPAASSARCAASPCISPSGRIGRTRSESPFEPRSAVLTVKTPGLRARLVGPQVERRPDEDVPEALDRALRLPTRAKLVPERLRSRARAPAHERLHDPHALAERDVPVAQQGGAGALDLGHPPVLVDHGQLERLAPDRAALADPREEAQVLGETAERDVLPVVGRRLGIALAPRQGLDRASERRPRLVQRHLVARVDQLESRAQAGEPSSHDRCSHRSSPAPTMRSLVSGESRREPSNTSNPRASMRSSVAR